MQTRKIKYLILLVLLFEGPVIYSQTDTGQTYFTKNISIDYYNGTKNQINFETHKFTEVTNIESIDNISILRFVNDSIISVSNESRANVRLNINKISGVGLKNGSNLGYGIAIGVLAGLGAGVAIGAANESPGWLKGFATAGGGALGILIGGLFGGMIGGFIPDYEMYELGDKYSDKKSELERILKIDSKINIVNY